MKAYPALDVRADATDLILAAVDDFSPSAIEERDDGLRVFFNSSRDRDAARAFLAPRFPADAIEVPDEDWARRSQESLQPITIGRLRIHPRASPQIEHRSEICNPASALTQTTRASSRLAGAPAARRGLKSEISLCIPPSTGFGTGHHATTRMCLEALQSIDLAGARVLDVGAGSGILAIAAAALGAVQALGVDTDEDAIRAARENLAWNPGVQGVTFEAADLASMAPLVEQRLGAADVVAANLTGALHVRSAAPLLAAARPRGMLILSGLQISECDDVRKAFAAAAVVRERTEGEWVCLVMKRA